MRELERIQHPSTPLQAASFEPATTRKNSKQRRFSAKQVLLIGLVLLALAIVSFLFLARAVVFRVEPFNAELQLSTPLQFHIGSNYLLLSGEYQLQASASGYLPLQRAITVTDDKNQLIDVNLQPLPAVVQIDSSLDGIEVLLKQTANDEPIAVGTAPSTIGDLPLGDYILVFRKHRYLPIEVPITLLGKGEKQQLTIELEPAWGELTINSSPEGAEVWVDNELRGVTPLTTEILQTGNEVLVKKDQYTPWQKTLSVAAGSSDLYPIIELSLAPATLTIQSTPVGANVTLNGKFIGTTPLETTVTARQQHKLQFFLAGYQKASRTIEAEPNQQLDMSLTLPAEFGDVRLAITPADAVVSIDGQAIVGNKTRLRLPAKPHTLTVSKDGYVSQTQQITPRPNLDQKITVRLLTETENRWAKVPNQITIAGIPLMLQRPNATFVMGASRREPGRRANEPERKVRLDKPFYIGKYEVTNQQFKQFAPNHSSRQIAGITLDLPNQPVANVSWQQAALFCNWLSQKDGLTPFYKVQQGDVVGFNADSPGYRLPTEAEWAWAARVENGETLRYSWGDNYPPTEVVANFKDQTAARLLGNPLQNYNDKYAGSATIGKFVANSKGLHDLDGNVAEWVNDYYAVGTPELGEPMSNPTGPERGVNYVVRGASWKMSSPSELRLSFRNFGDEAKDDVGFRIARYLE